MKDNSEYLKNIPFVELKISKINQLIIRWTCVELKISKINQSIIRWTCVELKISKINQLINYSMDMC